MSTSGAAAKREATATTEAAKPMDHLRSMKKPVYRSVRICLDSEIAEELSAADAELTYARIDNERNPSEETAKRLKELEITAAEVRERATERSMKFVFRSIGRKKYEEILLANQPTEEQKKRAIERGEDPDELDWDPDTFPPALIAASLHEPQLTLEDVTEIFDSPDWSAAELMTLYQTAQEAQVFSSVLNLGKD